MRPLVIVATLALATSLLTRSEASAEPGHHRHRHRHVLRHVKTAVKQRLSRLMHVHHHHHHHDRPAPDREPDPAELVAGTQEPIEAYAETWVTLGRELSVTEPSRFEIPAGPRPLRSLRIDCDEGAPRIDRIIIDYAGGDTERLTVDARLPPHGWRTLALDGTRSVRTITVVADPSSVGSYSIAGS